MLLLPPQLPFLLAVAASKSQLLNWDRALVQAATLSVIGVLLAALLMPFLIPALLRFPGLPRWIEWCVLGRGRRCLLPGAFLTVVGLLVGLTWARWLPGWMGIGAEYFSQSPQEKLQYDGLFGLYAGVPVAMQGTLVLATLVGGPLVGMSLSWLLYKLYEKLLSLKALAPRLVR